MYRKRYTSTSSASERGSILSFSRFQRLRKIITSLKTQISSMEGTNRKESFEKVQKGLESDDFWTAGFEMARFEKMHGHLDNTEMEWLINYQEYIHKQIKDHILSTIVVSKNQAQEDFHDWLNNGTPIDVVAAQSSKTFHKSHEIQTHLLGIKDWTRRAGFLSIIIKKGKQEWIMKMERKENAAWIKIPKVGTRDQRTASIGNNKKRIKLSE
ncbi:hypothetical protein O181_004915 [Austropuccinia psidii MF-1]|uniref:Uncharacterized protein n=1 Tax=Austropuccinia psidii MF-1 TaxID=1389203 RepID=A0A9Q3BHD6_9BASI|nr:hypothetical protein [Austropuccinia psidii MF-1]